MVNKEELMSQGLSVYSTYLWDKDYVGFAIYDRNEVSKEEVGELMRSQSLHGKLLGMIQLAKSRSGRYWYVIYSEALKGYGPILYEIAMSFATRDGKALISHEVAMQMGEALISGETSPQAKNVWNNFDIREDIGKSLHDEGFRRNKIEELKKEIEKFKGMLNANIDKLEKEKKTTIRDWKHDRLIKLYNNDIDFIRNEIKWRELLLNRYYSMGTFPAYRLDGDKYRSFMPKQLSPQSLTENRI
jgi:hypothetical protein